MYIIDLSLFILQLLYHILFLQVRAVYLSYLHKCLLGNYITCYKQTENDIASIEVKKCADQMELHAVRLALEATLYRQNMLRMVRKFNIDNGNKRNVNEFYLTFQ